jgi:hypothetical protein
VDAVEIEFQLPPGTRGRDLIVQLSPERLKVQLKDGTVFCDVSVFLFLNSCSQQGNTHSPGPPFFFNPPAGQTEAKN